MEPKNLPVVQLKFSRRGPTTLGGMALGRRGGTTWRKSRALFSFLYPVAVDDCSTPKNASCHDTT